MTTVRPMTPADWPAARAIAEGLPEWFDERARNVSIPIDLRHQRGLVAIQDGEVRGFALWYVAEGRLQIGWLGVRRDRHRQGLGRALLAALEAEARQLGLTELATHTLGDGVDYPPYELTRRFYFGSGFRVYQRSRTDNPSCPEEIRLAKPVPPDPGPAAQ